MSQGIRRARQKKPIWNKGLTRESDSRVDNFYKNRKLSDMGRDKLRENDRKTKNTCWYNNGSKQIRLCINETPPEGFVPGMLKRSKKYLEE